MLPYRSIAFALLGISIAIFGLSVSLFGLALTQVYPGVVNLGVLIGAAIALMGVIIAFVSAISLKE
jgi:hypothetical protein